MTDTLDIQKIRKLFPALSRDMPGGKPVFFDGPGGAQVPATVTEAMARHLAIANCNLFESPFYGVQSTQETVRNARSNAAAFLNCAPEEAVFGLNMTSLTLHISRAIAREWKAGDEIIVTALDHYANISFWKRAAQERGVTCHTVRIRPEDCTLDYGHLESLISPKTKLVAFTLASNVCGSRTDPARIVKAAKSAGALTFIDAVHYAPHILPDVRALDCDFLACSVYKFCGPHMGILYGKKEHLERLIPDKIEPAPERIPDRWETGTKNFEALAGFNATIEYLCTLGSRKNGIRESLQVSYEVIAVHEKNWAREFLSRAASVRGLQIGGITDPKRVQERTATFAMTFENHAPQTVSDHLARQNISAGAGHFYGMGVTEALGAPGGVVRAGAMHYNTLEEMDRLFAALDQLP